MPAITNHPCFLQPGDQSIKVWRYMDFTKFVSLISTQSLFLCRADLLGDPFEGSFSKANIRLRPEVYKALSEKNRDKLLQERAEFAKWIRQWTYINCWNMNECESAAMWKLYAKSDEAVAIQTIYTNLINSLPENVYGGLVQYIDYENDWLPEGNLFFPFLHKRKSFAHEKEVRIIHQKLPTSGNEIDIGKINDIEGIIVPVDLDLLIERVYVAPTSPEWYFNLIKEVLEKYEINKTIHSSKLDAEPVY